MPDFATDPQLLHHQYGTAEKLRIRQEAHELYSEEKTDYFAWILEFLALAPGMVVADVGCGPGAYHPLLAPLGCQAIGIDYSQGMLEEVRSQAQQQHLAVWAVRADAQHLPLATGCCDRLMANHMLYHVPDQRAALVLCGIEGLTNREASAVLGISEGAVEQRLVRARATLRERRGRDE